MIILQLIFWFIKTRSKINYKQYKVYKNVMLTWKPNLNNDSVKDIPICFCYHSKFETVAGHDSHSRS
jgi:hypothetical protein